ncbi:SURF1 family cytochrome oxidase biogenesis protein [Dietzia psychralcaliphila]|uniref:SURF1 family cytochrome oxidase biogenesis protein n=1 Tax=Dietzia psychralcaliphila TaxID=139021 RepID=UPI001C1E2F52|nr:SURF1 family cytochrome oxidase biogenesis protein [Dietzia psychralcaliphila]
MRSLRRFLSPGWLIGLLAVALFAWACFALLAPWQLGKSEDLDTRNTRLAESIEAAPAPFGQVVDGPEAFVDREWRLVTLDGQWRPDAEALLRLRAVDGEPVYQVLTVFDPVDGQEILVNRGYVPVGENNTVPDYVAAPAGPVEITARIRAAENGQAEPVLVDGLPAVRVLDPSVLGDTLDHPLVPAGYLQLTGDQPGSLSPVPIPGIENGPYLSYGLQWLAFGVLAPLALAYFAWAEIRARRRDSEGDDDVAAPVDTGGVDTGGVNMGGVDPDDAAFDARKRALRARYGQRDDAELRRAHRRADRLRT